MGGEMKWGGEWNGRGNEKQIDWNGKGIGGRNGMGGFPCWLPPPPGTGGFPWQLTPPCRGGGEGGELGGGCPSQLSPLFMLLLCLERGLSLSDLCVCLCVSSCERERALSDVGSLSDLCVSLCERVLVCV